MPDQHDPEYLLRETKREIERLRKQHQWFKGCLENKIVFAPVDLSDPSLKVLDVGCADVDLGILLRDLRQELAPSAKLVGLDYMPSFLPESPDGNIRYMTGDACERPAPDLAGTFNFTHKHLRREAGFRSKRWIFQQVAPSIPLHSTRFFNSLKPFSKRVNVTLQRLEIPAGKRIADETLRKLSIEPFKLTIPTVIGAAKAMSLELPDSIFDRLEERFEDEMLETGATFGTFVVCGQKSLR
ncbi:Methyltransferase fsdD [Colletotrichum fructicola]|nr:Methyltransferase fsdD [Colletotrichum fructicola]